MTGNTFGRFFRVTSFGESHGKAVGCVIDGCPPRLALSADDINRETARRRPGQSHYTTQRRETDEVTIASGVFEGFTTGAPIALWIANSDQRSGDYKAIQQQFRPGHADYTYEKKYGIRDWRGGGRSSARETAARVAAGAIAKKLLSERYGVKIKAYLSQMGDIVCSNTAPEDIDNNSFFCADPEKIPLLESLITKLRRDGDSIGAEVCVEAYGVPVGWGNPVFDRLDATLAHAMMSINAVKAVSVGDGFDVVNQRGSVHRDEITPEDGFLSNHSGGILGGISTGQSLRVKMAFKPTSSIMVPGKTIDKSGAAVDVVTKGRHDPCVGIRGVPIAEAMMALVLIDHALVHEAQCND